MLKPSTGKSLQISACAWGKQKIVLDTLFPGNCAWPWFAWTVALNGNNLFDKTDYNTVVTASWVTFYGEPRHFTGSLKGNFQFGESPAGRALSATRQPLLVLPFLLPFEKVFPSNRKNLTFVSTLKNTPHDRISRQGMSIKCRLNH
jgi:hypothetical protein